MQSKSKLSIRPQISTKNSATTPSEQFQNLSLRPILKLQNDLLIALVQYFLKKRKIDLETKGLPEQKKQLQQLLSKDNSLRNQLLGLVMGQFTMEEWTTYQSIESEARKRIFSMLEERLIDQMLPFEGLK